MAISNHLCDSCSSLGLKRDDFTSSTRADRSIIGEREVAQLVASKQTCPLCNLICLVMEHQRMDASVPQQQHWTLQWERCRQMMEPTAEEWGSIFEWAIHVLPDYMSEASSERGIQLIGDRDTRTPLRARLTTQEPDFSLYKRWLRNCLDFHASCSSSHATENDPWLDEQEKFMVVDVKCRCLSMERADVEYAALSYVWGKNNTPLTFQSNKSEFFKEDSLRDNLPQTISDTIQLVEAMGIAYLWVDSLCIVQDDFNLKESLINRMDRIYANAIITIVAATGKHSRCGLSGYGPQSRRALSSKLLPNGDTVGILPLFERQLMDSDHAQRGWT
jgi:hypothetical protein